MTDSYTNHYFLIGLSQYREFRKNPDCPTVGLEISSGKKGTGEERIQAFMEIQLEKFFAGDDNLSPQFGKRMPAGQAILPVKSQHASRAAGWYNDVDLMGITAYERWMIARTTGKAVDLAHSFSITEQQVLAIKAMKAAGKLVKPANWNDPMKQRPGHKKIAPELRIEIGNAAGTFHEVAERYQVTTVTVRNYRKRYGST